MKKDIIKYLFLDVIRANTKKEDLLKPLALKVLESLVESTIQSGDTNRRLACIKAIIHCDPQFDTLTKTKTIADMLVPPSTMVVAIATQYQFWGTYFSHLESKFLDLCCTKNASKEAQAYIELMYTSAKQILSKRIDDEQVGNAGISECKNNITKRVLGFFMSTAFFDCSTSTILKESKKKKGNHVLFPSQTITESAIKVKNGLKDGQKITYPIRMRISSLFFSLVSDFVIRTSKVSKDSKDSLLALLEVFYDNIIELESKNAHRFISVEVDERGDDDSDEDDSPERIINDLRRKVVDLKKNGNSDKESRLYQSKKRCMTGITSLAITLHLHRLSCGSDEEMNEDPDADEEEDEENICNAISELEVVSSQFLELETEGSNPLLGVAEICANILSSPLGSGDMGRGAAPTLVCESVKVAWLGCLTLASEIATKDRTLLDNTVVDLLMDAIGAPNSSKDAADDEDADMSSVNDSDDSDEEPDDKIFSKASKVLDDSDDSEYDEKDVPKKEKDDSDIELDPSKLQTMLEDENLDDVEDIALEHHEGADAALAKLIKLKQENRKVGQEAREKIEVPNQ